MTVGQRLNTKTTVLLVLLSIFILLTATPFIDFMYSLNQQLKLPSSLSWLEKKITDAENADTQGQIAPDGFTTGCPELFFDSTPNQHSFEKRAVIKRRKSWTLQSVGSFFTP